jgi:membrane dipeptidase
VTFVPRFVSQAVRDWALEAQERAVTQGVDPRDIPAMEAVEAAYAKEVPHPPASISDVVEHLEHVRDVAGVDHVGLGGDYDGVDWLPSGLEDVTGYPRLLAALRDRGWSDEDLAKLTCRNVLRTLRGAESVAEGEND